MNYTPLQSLTNGLQSWGKRVLHTRWGWRNSWSFVRSAANIWQNLTLCVKILSSFWKIFTNLTSRDNNKANTPEVLYSADIAELVNQGSNSTSHRALRYMRLMLPQSFQTFPVMLEELRHFPKFWKTDKIHHLKLCQHDRFRVMDDNCFFIIILGRWIQHIADLPQEWWYTSLHCTCSWIWFIQL